MHGRAKTFSEQVSESIIDDSRSGMSDVAFRTVLIKWWVSCFYNQILYLSSLSLQYLFCIRSLSSQAIVFRPCLRYDTPQKTMHGRWSLQRLTARVMEGQHQGVDRSVTLAAAAHCRRQKPMGSHHHGGVCRSAPNDTRVGHLGCSLIAVRRSDSF